MGSKLEMYVDILNVLEQRGPLKVSHIMLEVNVNCNVLKGYLDFLINQGLIEEREVGQSGVVYANTDRGAAVIKFFIELRQNAFGYGRRRQNLASSLIRLVIRRVRGLLSVFKKAITLVRQG